MNTLTLVIVGLLGLLVITFIVQLVLAITLNVRSGTKYRHALAAELNRLRLRKMLAGLGIDINAYLARERVVNIRKQIKNCAICLNTHTCDEALSDGDIDPHDIGYCSNEKALQKLTRN